MIQHQKLVRDNIPEIIRKAGKKCETYVLTDDEYIKTLDDKLEEEMLEYRRAKSVEELIDIVEVIHAIVKARGYSLNEFESLRKEKAEKNGVFNKKIFLISSER